MCGIAGYFGKQEIDAQRIEECLGRMRRRGPDFAAARHWVNKAGNHVHLLHSRLSIIDLDERANQPFNVGSKWIALNGELYNYLEVRSALKADGAAFRTESDTEVLLMAIEREGWGVLDQCEGMWAFAVYDEGNGSLTLSRDRFGEKPLYLYRDDTGVYFGSEIKFIAAMLGHQLEINYNHLYRYVINGYRALYHADETFFKGVAELKPASVLHLSTNGGEEQYRYWKPSLDPDDSMTLDEAVQGTRDLLIKSVDLRLRSDVPLAFCMSGGIDSNSLICTAKRIFDYDVHGFTIVNDDHRYNEQDEVNHVVRELGLRHTAVPITSKDFLKNIIELVSYHDAPVITISYYIQWLLMSQIAESGYRVSVSGSAGDELFSGYYDHFLAFFHEMRKRHPEIYKEELRVWEAHVKSQVRNPYLSNPNLFADDPDFRGYNYLNAKEFASYFYKPWGEPFVEEKYSDGLLRNRMLNELFHESIPPILHEDDLNAMYFSIENRSPFLDRELFEFASRIPTRHLIRDGFAKAVLRHAMTGIVPDAVLWNRRKVGFNAPVYSFFDVKDPTVREWFLDGGLIYEHVDRKKMERFIAKKNLPNSESKFLFYFICAKAFVDRFAEEGLGDV